MDKVKFGIKNVHFFPMTADTPVYGDVIPVPGTVSLSLDAQAEINKFYADNIVYYQTSANNGYEGDLQIANIPEAVMTEILDFVKDENGVITEMSNAHPKAFAMSFEEEGDTTGTKFVLYNVTLTKPSRSYNTVEESKTPTTQTLKLSAVPLKDGKVMAMSSDDDEKPTSPEVLTAWHEGVYGYTN